MLCRVNHAGAGARQNPAPSHGSCLLTCKNRCMPWHSIRDLGHRLHGRQPAMQRTTRASFPAYGLSRPTYRLVERRASRRDGLVHWWRHGLRHTPNEPQHESLSRLRLERGVSRPRMDWDRNEAGKPWGGWKQSATCYKCSNAPTFFGRCPPSVMGAITRRRGKTVDSWHSILMAQTHAACRIGDGGCLRQWLGLIMPCPSARG